MSAINQAMEYLKNNTFIPHENGNDLRYGLNSFGCNSVIQYNNHYWKFLWFLSDSNDALYVNKNGETFTLSSYTLDGIIRMQPHETIV